jgi:hypothetical protein
MSIATTVSDSSPASAKITDGNYGVSVLCTSIVLPSTNTTVSSEPSSCGTTSSGIRLLSSWRPVSWFRYTSTTYPFSSTLEEVHCLQYFVTFHLDYSLWVEDKILKDGFRLHEVGKIMGVSRLALAAEEQRALIRLFELAKEEHGNGYQAQRFEVEGNAPGERRGGGGPRTSARD